MSFHAKCPGYKRDLKWSDKHEVFHTARPDDLRAREPAPAPPAPVEQLGPISPTAAPRLPLESFPRTLIGPTTQIVPPQSLSSSTDIVSPTHTPPQDVEHPDPGAFSGAAAATRFNHEVDRSTADILRDDLREWLVSHEPMTLLEQQDWTWTLNGSTLGCDDASAFMDTTTTTTALDDRDATAASQGSEFNQALVQYFFDHLCKIHSVLDDSAEGFKALVCRYLRSSPLLHKSIVCMAAVHCFQDEDCMLLLCLECHTAAVRSLSEAVFQIETVIEQSTDSRRGALLSEEKMLRKLEETLLSSIILGFCAPWPDPRDLGLPHLRGARKLCEYLINHVTMDGTSPEKALANPDHFFLIGAMAYWEACMAFVVDQPKNVVQYLYPFTRPTETTYIHMFAGISLPLFVTLARVAICVRQNRMLRNMVSMGWKDRDPYQMVAAEVVQDAIELARYAVDYELPADDSFDTKTLGTSTCRQIKAYAQMCKFAILLELHRNFPSLVDPPLDEAEATSPGSRAAPPPMNLDHLYYDLSGAVLSHAKDIPEGSVCGLYQTILLIVCGSVLRSTTPPPSLFAGELSLHAKLDAQLLCTLARPRELEKRRAFIRRRLQSNCASFGLQKVFCRAERLLAEVWTELDAGGDEADVRQLGRHWIDVMADHKLETFFG